MSTTTVDQASKRKPTPTMTGGPPSKKSSMVPRVVPVDMDSPPVDAKKKQPETTTTTTAAVAATTTTNAPSSSNNSSNVIVAVPKPIGDVRVSKKVDWEIICDREILKSLLTTPDSVSKNGSAYLSFDTAFYETTFKKPVYLGRYNHLIVEGPYMSNMWGIGTKVHGQSTSHSICFDVNDTMVDKNVLKFSQFLAMCDEVCLEVCVRLVISQDAIKSQVPEWLTFCTSASGEVDMRKLEEIVASKFNGALRQSKKSKEDKTITQKSVIWIAEENRFVIPSQFFFKTKINGKRQNDKLIDLPCYNSKNQRVYYSAEKGTFRSKDGQAEEKPVLCAFRGSWVKPQCELPSINFVQKEFWATWVTKKIKYKSKFEVEAEYDDADAGADDECDFDDQDSIVITDAEALKRISEQEKAASNNVDIDMSVPTDD